jgi:hypothetical protein
MFDYGLADIATSLDNFTSANDLPRNRAHAGKVAVYEV